MVSYSKAAMERTMKIQEVWAMAGKITRFQAAEILKVLSFPGTERNPSSHPRHARTCLRQPKVWCNSQHGNEGGNRRFAWEE